MADTLPIRKPGSEDRRVRTRLFVCAIAAILGTILLLARLAQLQWLRHEEFQTQAENNRLALVPVAPTRGLIYDRNGVLLAENVAYHTLEIAPSRFRKLDQTVADLAGLVEITPREITRFKRLMEDSRRLEPLPLKTRLTETEVARIAAQRYRLPGVELRARLFRSYPQGELAAHVIGHIGRISQKDLRDIERAELGSRYAGTSHIGKIGIEKSYETVLQGRPGYEEVEVSAQGKVVRTVSRVDPTGGASLHLTIDSRLQALAEALFAGRRGALVALEPATGEVLAMVSAPGFDPNLFVDGIDTATWQALNEDPDTPLLNRALRGTYPPGSTYKPFLALAALDSGFRRPADSIVDPGYFQLGEHRFRDSRPGGHGTVDLFKSIVVSSDTYYYKLAYDMGVDRMHRLLSPWGFGQRSGIDLDHEVPGILPSSEWKYRRYGKRWLPGETPSVGIGQGYNAFTMLQLARATAALAHGGRMMRPHLVRGIQPAGATEPTILPKQAPTDLGLKPEHMRLVTRAMVDVNRLGTSRAVFAGVEYSVAGKTGTSQVIGIRQNERYDAKKIAERHRDHSLYVAFAPVQSPRIALAVIVENGGFGAQAAAPVARTLLDFYLLGRLPAEQAALRLPVTLDDAEMRDVPETIGPEDLGVVDTQASPNRGPEAAGR